MVDLVAAAVAMFLWAAALAFLATLNTWLAVAWMLLPIAVDYLSD